MRISIFSLLFFCLAGCSKPAPKPDEALLIQSAIQFSYPSIYSDLSDLRKDYPSFTPRVRQWSSDLSFLIAEGFYAVQLPEEEVIVTRDGVVKTRRHCGSVEADCTLVMPKDPKLSIVGTVQLGAPGYSTAEGVKVSWKGTAGYVNVVGNCFAASKSSSEPLILVITVPSREPLEISEMYGARLMAITFDTKGTSYSSKRIPQSMFLESKTCSDDAKRKWPNVGGTAWKR